MDTAQLDKSLVDLWPLGPVSSYSINTETYIDGERIAITVDILYGVTIEESPLFMASL